MAAFIDGANSLNSLTGECCESKELGLIDSVMGIVDPDGAIVRCTHDLQKAGWEEAKRRQRKPQFVFQSQ
jgi:hypothetical protein